MAHKLHHFTKRQLHLSTIPLSLRQDNFFIGQYRFDARFSDSFESLGLGFMWLYKPSSGIKITSRKGQPMPLFQHVKYLHLK